MFVCLWSPVWRTVADSLADLSPALLTVAPRVVTEERRGGLVWVDARGLDAERMARSALDVLRNLGLSNVRVGVGETAIIAELMAAEGTGNREPGTEAASSQLLAATSTQPSVPGSRFLVPAPSDSRFPTPDSLSALGILPVTILEPDPALATLLEGIGIETCGDLAALAGESVEIRLGADGVRLWKLARGDDDRLIFKPLPRELPHASLEWSDYALTDTERLLFSVNALLGTVCEKLIERGSLAREMTLDLSLANRNTLTHPIRAGRATASRKTWLRLAKMALERMVLPAGVTGLTLSAATVITDEGSQGDLFDRGFATAAVTEAALASLAEEQGDVVVVPENSGHPLVERRTRWVEQRESGVGNRESKKGNREPGTGNRRTKQRKPRQGEQPNDQLAAPVPGSQFPVPQVQLVDSRLPTPDSRLTLYLLPTPRAIEAQTEERRDHILPTAYRDGGAWYKVLSSAGPDRVSGERWGEAYAREYFRCVIDDGGMVWLYHDARADGWYIHGWWD